MQDDEKKINDLLGKKGSSEKVAKKEPVGFPAVLTYLFIGLAAGAIITAAILGSWAQDVEGECIPTTICSSDEVVLIYPTGCDELCRNITVPASNLALENDLSFRNVQLNANISVPGIFMIKDEVITDIVPFDSETVLPLIFCNEFGFEKYC